MGEPHSNPLDAITRTAEAALKWGNEDFCSKCGRPLTDEAVDMVVKRLEALNGETEAN